MFLHPSTSRYRCNVRSPARTEQALEPARRERAHHHRHRRGGEVKLGVERARHALDGDERLDQERGGRRDLDAVPAGQAEELAHEIKTGPAWRFRPIALPLSISILAI